MRPVARLRHLLGVAPLGALLAAGCFDFDQFAASAAYDAAVVDRDASRHDAHGRDLAARPDLAAPDLSTPDLAPPDGPPVPDLAAPDLEPPDDLAAPDLAALDLAATDLAPAPDLATPPDLAPLGCGFGVSTVFGVGAKPVSLAVGDFDGDGLSDLAIVNESDTLCAPNACQPGQGDLLLRAGDGKGGFRPKPLFVWGPESLLAVFATDLDGDGKLDLVALGASGVLYSLIGDGKGGFLPPSKAMLAGPPVSAALGDFDGDKKVDAVVSVEGMQQALVQIAHGNGDGTFMPLQPMMVAKNSNPRATAAGDFNGDHDDDALIGFGAMMGWSIDVLLYSGGFPYFVEKNVAKNLNSEVNALVARDVNGDGKLDVAGVLADRPFVMLGNGDGSFQPPAALDPGPNGKHGFSSLAVDDFDGDGHLDIAAADADPARLRFLTGDGTGAFSAWRDCHIGLGARQVVSGDFDNDGLRDVATVNRGDDTVTVLLNGH